MKELHDSAPARNKFLRCASCGGTFTAQRSSARFCSTRCRMAAHSAIKSAQGIAGANRFSVIGNPRIVADARRPGMWRLQLADGTLTDLVNLTRARDALASLAAARRSQGRASGVLGAALDRLAAETERAN
jgi:hypothetical protein